MVRCSDLFGVGRLQPETIRFGIEHHFKRKPNETTKKRDSTGSAAQIRASTVGRISTKS